VRTTVKATTPGYRFFLGGHDLEMVTISALVTATLGPGHIVDRHLRWGAVAAAYADDIRLALDQGATPVLVELPGELPGDMPRHGMIDVDHHGARAGATVPSSLRQVFQLLRLPEAAWTREHALVDANDIAHLPGMRAIRATADEIRAIRLADRQAQGVTLVDERLARAALTRARRCGPLLIVASRTTRTSPLLDFLEPEYGGPGASDVVVTTPSTVEFYGRGELVAQLSALHYRSWFGGALPQRGFWGLSESNARRRRRVVRKITALAVRVAVVRP
jgi:hypothetical protein